MRDHPPLTRLEDENELVQSRLKKLRELRERGCDPFAIERFERSHSLGEIAAHYDQLEGQTVQVAGRLMWERLMGKAAFAHLFDGESKLQIYLKLDELGEKFEFFKLSDVGDYIGVKGFVFRTRTEEITVHVQEYTILSKAIRPVPFAKERGDERFAGLHDVQQRYRHRYLDLLTNPESRQALMGRCRMISEVRRFLDNEGFIEVETPILQPVASGAAARPFATHHNEMGIDLHLRIALELYLKRLIVGGIDKVYEIGRVFRNEGITTRHNPEFTMLELYQAYADLEDIMDLVERLFRGVAQSLTGSTQIEFDGRTIDFGPAWPRRRLTDLIEEYAGVPASELQTLESARRAADRIGLHSQKRDTAGAIIEKMLEQFVEPNLIQPTFVVGYPLETSPLAKRDPGQPGFTRRFEAYVAGLEVANAFSELNDPLDQRERFEAQACLRAAGDDEAQALDSDFLFAMEHGMPPTGGLGIGMDRMAMLLAGAKSIKDVIFFPQMKPEHEERE